MRQFFLEDKGQVGQEVLLSLEDSHHLIHVLRAQAQEEIQLVSGGQVFEAVYLREEGGRARVRLVQEKASHQTKRRVILIQAMVKGQKFETILQHGTEVGIDGFYPIQLARSVSDIRAKYPKKRDRFEKILRGAAEQSNALEIPFLGDYLTLKDIGGLLGPEDLLLIPYEEEKPGQDLANLLGGVQGDIYYLIGPEGGFSPEEIAYLKKIGGRTLSLGPRILRSETAALVAGFMLKNHLEGSRREDISD
ncbi:MAG: RsmE family RNA methyltransferase [Tissierellia bacterium]|nr:RsmE family RNA methyltransferase [Tissierellia bacterium]